ncbi:TonB-dependent receptor [Gaoshiqia sp. Z1-71]|uniref:TonB-dependent receptor n=1 Tax=Gaoshiqia hydrogeniformans TaxID=3290090 RepID=UPI003BF82A3E
MRLTLFFTFVFVANLFASSYSQNTRLSLEYKDIQLKQLFELISEQSEFRFIYNNDVVNDDIHVSVNARDVRIETILDDILNNTHLGYRIVDRHIIVYSEDYKGNENLNRPGLSFQSGQIPVSGKVTDVNGDPLPGVSVSVKGTVMGSITDAEGRFTIQVADKNTVIVFSFIGMKSQEVLIGNRTTFNIILEEETIGIDEVVAIGYTNARKQDLSVAVSTVKVGDNFKGRPSSLGTILQGQITGVTVTQSGDPTSSAEISIRGKGNKNGDAVLYVVDGVPGAPFNPADIETITVLKDAASAAIYGAYAGSGGVILVTTKQAKEGKVIIEANVWNGYQTAWQLPEVLSSEDFNKVWKDASAAAGKTVPIAYDPLLFPYGNVTRTDWVDEIFRTGRIQHYDLTLRGGSKEIKALASISYDNTEGTLINTYADKLTTRLNVDFTPTTWVTIRQKMTYDFGNGKSAVGDGHTGSIFAAMAYPRFSTVYEYDESGNKLYGGTVPRWALAEGYSVEADLRNPVAMLEKVRQYNPDNRLFSNTSVELKPFAGLSLKSDFSVDIKNSRRESFQMRFLEPGRTIDENYRSISNTLYKNWIWENIASYSKVLNEKHYISVLAGFTLTKTNSRYNWSQMKGFAIEEEHQTTFLNGTDWTIKPEEDIWEESSVSALSRLSYSYADRYFLNGSIRRDASSKLSPGNNSDLFPAVSGAWKISSEPFMKNNLPEISFLKLRASWGQVGNINSVRRFIYAPPYQVTGWPLFLGEDGEVQAYGIYQTTIPNPNLKWERTEQTNVGLDFGLFKNALNVSVDYFYKHTKDLIESMPVPSVAGVASPPEYNVGEVVNKGWELSFTYNKKIGDVTLDLGANLGTFKNEVKSIGATSFIAHTNDVNSMKPLQSTAGQPWHSFYLIDAIGIFKSQAEIDSYTWTNPSTGTATKIQASARPGDLKFRDANNDGMINDGDRVYMGSYDVPDLSYGFNIGASWKNFSIHMIFQGVSGVKIFNGVKAMTYTGSKGWNMSVDVLDSYEYNPNSGMPRLAVVEDPNGNYSKVSDFFLEKGDYLRLKNLNVSYAVPKSLTEKIGLNNSSFRVYMNGENLLTFTNYSGFDPEVGNLGIDAGRYPVARMLSLGLNVTF